MKCGGKKKLMKLSVGFDQLELPKGKNICLHVCFTPGNNKMSSCMNPAHCQKNKLNTKVKVKAFAKKKKRKLQYSKYMLENEQRSTTIKYSTMY